MPIAAVIKGTTYAVHSDHLNTPRKLTQANGQTAWQWAYSAFGDEQPTIAAKRFTSETTNPTTGATSTPEVTFNLRYPGQYFDKETKLHYNYYRSYDSRTGRYTQGDPIGLNGGWNRFGYVDGNPLSYTDPEGLRPLPKPPSESRNQPDCDSNGCKVFCLGAPGHYGVFCTTYHLIGGRWRTVNVEFIAWLGRPWSFIGTYSCEDFNNLKNPYGPNIN